MEQNPYLPFLNDVRKFIPQNRIYTDELRRLAWGTDAGFYRLIPRIVIRSANEAEVSRIVGLADSYNLPYTFRAAGTSLSGQAISDSILIVAGKHWEKYSISADHSQITLGPGITGARVNRLLAPYQRKFAPDPASVNSSMVGGIVINNASGMNCGTHANSDKVLISARMVLTDGTILDTGDPVSRSEFEASHPDFLKRVLALRDKVQSQPALTERIRYKYSIKNVTGLNILPLAVLTDPFDIIAHLLVGSEGTLAFLSRVTMRTQYDYPCKASAMAYFKSLKEACTAIVKLKSIQATGNDMELTGEDLAVKSAELLDSKSLSSVNDPVFLRYKQETENAHPGTDTTRLVSGLTAVLIETKAVTPEQLKQRVGLIEAALQPFDTYTPVHFTDKPDEYRQFWDIRAGIFPSVGGTRAPGTTCLIEDIAFHVEQLPEAVPELQALIARHGYDDACIYGHAFEGNFHFILNQSFETGSEVTRYERMMKDVIRLVVEKYDGSLKAEHGTGRNMAPFVKYEWGDEAFELMREVKNLFDPKGLLNPGVIFNDDPACFISHFKPLPVLRLPEQARAADPRLTGPTALETIEGVEQVNRCIECGFCEINCLTCGFTLSSRQRIVIQREIARLRQDGSDPELEQKLTKQYSYLGNATCAGDGLCATSCPMGINTGHLTHLLRQLELPKGSTGYRAGAFAARHFGGVKSALRPVLWLAHMGHTVLGTKLMSSLTQGMHRALRLPLWTPAMPKPIAQPKPAAQTATGTDTLKVVYFPSCINQTMGLPQNAQVKQPLVTEMTELLRKAGYEVIFPPRMESLCCGTIWESKGMPELADQKTAELEEALWQASEQGRYPVLCDQSPCLHRMRARIKRMKMYEPAEFIYTFLADRLIFTPTDRPVVLHLTCSSKELHVDNLLVKLAERCSTRVLVPAEVGCCGFAGDRGFTHPEVNAYALRKLRPQIEAAGIRVGYSNSRTCEIGLMTNTGIPYVSIAYLVNECTQTK